MSDIVTFITTACRPAQTYLFLVLLNVVFAFFGKFKFNSTMYKVFISLFVFTILFAPLHGLLIIYAYKDGPQSHGLLFSFLFLLLL